MLLQLQKTKKQKLIELSPNGSEKDVPQSHWKKKIVHQESVSPTALIKSAITFIYRGAGASYLQITHQINSR